MILPVELDEMKLLVLGAINSSAPPRVGFLVPDFSCVQDQSSA